MTSDIPKMGKGKPLPTKTNEDFKKEVLDLVGSVEVDMGVGSLKARIQKNLKQEKDLIGPL